MNTICIFQKAKETGCRILIAIVTLLSATAATAQVPLYNSYPSASAVLFLDFDGHTVDATAWNYDGPIVCGASGLNSTQITEVFNRVAEDYRPFNINITTDSLKYLAAPVNKRMRVILTVTSEWFGAAGGVAFTGSFTWGDDTPCFVFSALLGNNTKNIGEASSHEAGHTLGLYHQSTYDANCVRVSEYNYGNGSGEIGWAPIMGVGYYRNLTLWNNGPNPYGCTNYQSDLDIITTGNGFTFRTDDYGNSFASSMVVPFTANQFLFSGVIEKNTDMDMVRFTLPVKGRFTLNAVPYNVGTGNSGSNLDLQVTLYNTAQTQLNVYNPAMILSSVIDSVMDAGTYYLKIEGRGNIYAPNYASLGSYSLQANFTGGVLPLRKLELRGTIAGDRHQLNWLIDADEQVVKQVLEFSTDGRNFNPLIQPLNTDRSFSHTALSNNNTLYRLSVTFDNGHQYYSNIISLQSGTKSKPKVVNSFVSTGILMVTSPALYAYNVYDMNGRVLGKGQIKSGQNSIPVSQYVPGMYIIEFNQGNESYSEKFIRK